MLSAIANICSLARQEIEIYDTRSVGRILELREKQMQNNIEFH